MTKLLPLDQRPYRLGVGVVMLNAEGLAFTAKRIDTPGTAWQFPQGGIDEGEDPREAALRELEEEIGTNNVEVLAESDGWIAYDLPQELADRSWKGRFRGQKQKWYCVRFLGKDRDINLDTKHPEFCQWQWMRLAEVPGLIVPFKRELYDRVVEAFIGLAAD